MSLNSTISLGKRSYPGLLLAGVLALATTGCATQGPQLGFLAFPIPISPYQQKLKEDQAWIQERYARVPVLEPMPMGFAAKDIPSDPPSHDEIMRALERARPVQGGVPMQHEVQRNNVRIQEILQIANYIDPPRVVPLIGPVQLHHVHWRVTVRFSETIRVGWPVPHTKTDEEVVEVLYIDHNHFHRVGDPNQVPHINF